MKKITLPTPATGTNQAYFTALSEQLIPKYFDSVHYCDAAGNEYSSVDVMNGSSYAVTRVDYYKHGVRAMCFFLSGGALSGQSPRFAGKDGVTSSSSGTYIQSAPTSLTICHDAILLGALQASSAPYSILLVKHNADTIAVLYRPPYMNSSTRVNATLSTLNLGKGKINYGNQIQIFLPSTGATTNEFKLQASYYVITMRIPTIDGADSVLTSVRYILAGPGFDMVASEAIALDGVVYDMLGLLLIESQASAEYTDIVINSDNRHMIGYTGAANENLIIPHTFVYGGTAYRVTGLAERAFADCTRLTTASIANGVTAIPDEAFAGCAALRRVYLPSSVISIGNSAFFNCYNLGTITIPAKLQTIGDNAFSPSGSLASVMLPASVASIGENAFRSSHNLTDITINKPEDSISGAPWGAPNATVTWTG